MIRVALLLIVLAMPASAQQQAVLRGNVKDQSSLTVIPATEVQLLDGRDRRVAQALTDSAGRFTFPGLLPGQYRIRAQALGFKRVETPPFVVADSAEVVVWLSAQAISLAPLEIVSRAQPVHRHFGVREFYERMERRMGGAFITKEEIANRGPDRLTDLLNTVGSFEANRSTEQLYNIRNPGCAPAVWLDGVRVTRPADAKGRAAAAEAYRAVNMLLPTEIEGMEVYAGAATVPAAYSGTGGGCGVILIWGKRQ